MRYFIGISAAILVVFAIVMLASGHIGRAFYGFVPAAMGLYWTWRREGTPEREAATAKMRTEEAKTSGLSRLRGRS